jgi:ATP synthase alpha/beta family, beta-barrel domain
LRVAVTESGPMKALAEQIVDIDGVETYGRVVSVRGLMVEVAGPIHAMSVGARLTIETGSAKIPCEAVGFSGGHALAMPFAALDGVRRGCRAVVTTAAGAIRPSERWLGRVVNARAEPIDGQGPLPLALRRIPYRASPPPAQSRRRVGEPPGSRGARAQYLHHRLPWPTHGYLLRLRRRQVGSTVDASSKRLGRYFGDRACRRARPRGPGISARRSGRSGFRALGRGCLHLG